VLLLDDTVLLLEGEGEREGGGPSTFDAEFDRQARLLPPDWAQWALGFAAPTYDTLTQMARDRAQAFSRAAPPVAPFAFMRAWGTFAWGVHRSAVHELLQRTRGMNLPLDGADSAIHAIARLHPAKSWASWPLLAAPDLSDDIRRVMARKGVPGAAAVNLTDVLAALSDMPWNVSAYSNGGSGGDGGGDGAAPLPPLAVAAAAAAAVEEAAPGAPAASAPASADAGPPLVQLLGGTLVEHWPPPADPAAAALRAGCDLAAAEQTSLLGGVAGAYDAATREPPSADAHAWMLPCPVRYVATSDGDLVGVPWPVAPPAAPSPPGGGDGAGDAPPPAAASPEEGAFTSPFAVAHPHVVRWLGPGGMEVAHVPRRRRPRRRRRRRHGGNSSSSSVVGGEKPPPRPADESADELPVAAGSGCPPRSLGQLCRVNHLFAHVFVLTLPRRRERWLRLSRQLWRLGISHTLLHGYDGQAAALAAMWAAGSARLQGTPARPMSADDVATFASHLDVLAFTASLPAASGGVLLLADTAVLLDDEAFERQFDAQARLLPRAWKQLFLGGTLRSTDRASLADPRGFAAQLARGVAKPVPAYHVKGTYAVGWRPAGAATLLRFLADHPSKLDRAATSFLAEAFPGHTLVFFPVLAIPDTAHAAAAHAAGARGGGAAGGGDCAGGPPAAAAAAAAAVVNASGGADEGGAAAAGLTSPPPPPPLPPRGGSGASGHPRWACIRASPLLWDAAAYNATSVPVGGPLAPPPLSLVVEPPPPPRVRRPARAAGANATLANATGEGEMDDEEDEEQEGGAAYEGDDAEGGEGHTRGGVAGAARAKQQLAKARARAQRRRQRKRQRARARSEAAAAQQDARTEELLRLRRGGDWG
jgi:hypothetical protein